MPDIRVDVDRDLLSRAQKVAGTKSERETVGLALRTFIDAAIGREAAEMPLSELVSRLREIIGVRLVAYVGNVKTTSAVTAWADGRQSPDDDDVQRLRLTFDVVRLLQERYDKATISSWLKGMNPDLDDEAPAQAISEASSVEAARKIVRRLALSFALLG